MKKIFILSPEVAVATVHEENDSKDEISARGKYSEFWTGLI